MGFRDLREVFDPDLYLPVGGKNYRIPAATMEQAERLKKLILIEMTDEQELAEIQELFGPLHDELLADGVKWPEYLHIGRTALLWAGSSDEKIAEAHWHYAQLGVLVDFEKLQSFGQTQNRAERRAAVKAAPRKPRKRTAKKAG